MAARVGTAASRAPSAHARALAVATPMRTPVKLPGPSVTATTSTSVNRRPAVSSTWSTTGSSASA
jgi:hypothetical protein